MTDKRIEILEMIAEDLKNDSPLVYKLKKGARNE